MITDQILLLAILTATLVLFLWGRWRHDVVALAALVACILAGLIPSREAFAGFGHPAVITVAAVLILSRGLQTTGAVDLLTRTVLPAGAGRTLTMAALLGLGAALSAFMNNVGAMALLMPVAIQQASRIGVTPGQMLMPLAFATILGGMTTLVGTPPNLIVSGFRESAGNGGFAMFDFAPAGLAVALAGISFVVLGGWRLVPVKRPSGADAFETAAYFTEVEVPEGSKLSGKSLRHIEDSLSQIEAQIVGLVRNNVRISAPHRGLTVRDGDILVLEADVEGLAETLSALDLKLEAEKRPRTNQDDAVPAPETDSNAEEDGKEPAPKSATRPDDIVVKELAVLPGSTLVGRSARELQLRSRYGLNLLAVSREDRKPQVRLRTLSLRSGDVLLLQGPVETLADFASETGCVPLAERELRLPQKRKAILAGAIMIAAVALATFGILPAEAAFTLGVLVSMVTGTVPPRTVYTAVDWPVIVLLGALMPVAGAMETTGTASLIAETLVATVAQGNAIAALALVLVVTMTLSDVMNNAATAAVMAPIAVGIAAALGGNPDSFLMAVAIGASCAFLTPIGHQNNTLILGPGGFSFGDYWRLGLPMELIITAVALPVLILVWGL